MRRFTQARESKWFANNDHLACLKFWFYVRNLTWDEIFELERTEMWNGQLWTLYKYLPTEFTLADWEKFQILYHGGTFYGLENTVRAGKFFASEDTELGHGLLEDRGGVITTRNPSVAAGYSPGHDVFGNGVYHKIVWELLCKDGFRTVRKPPGKDVNEQMAYSENGVKVRGA